MLYEPELPDSLCGMRLGRAPRSAWSVREPTVATAALLTKWYLDSLADVKRFLQRRYRLRQGDVEDVCQELFVRLIEYGQGRVVDNPRAYILRSAVNVLQNVNARAQVRLPHRSEWTEQLVADSDEEPEQVLQRTGEICTVVAAIRLLTSRQQRFIALHFHRGLS